MVNPVRDRAKTPRKAKKRQSEVKDPVEVLCRLRTLPNSIEESCITVIDDSTVLLQPPEQSRAFQNSKEVQYKFNKVFGEVTGQTDLFRSVGYPLVDDLIKGRNGLLFTYGITGSGKTYTVTGTPQDGGLLPRSLDVIFNSIGDFQAKKYVFKPDRQNGFDIQTDVDAMLERQQRDLMPNNNNKFPSSNLDHISAGRVPDQTRVEDVDEDNAYAVFVSYCEIYNNYVYDLLEEPQQDNFGRNKPPQTKKLREDMTKTMYVESLLEVEVKSTEEAYEVLLRGDRNRRKAQTVLNHESSRSHSSFNVRLVQAPLDPAGEEVLLDKNQVCISQLSLVDLAGSERQDRTKSAGDRLKEAGQINNSLMTLRACIEILRDNQQTGGAKMVPYRDSRVTHLFKNFFDGEGKVKMIVCVNPMAADYDETLHVMKFAEMTQEVQTTRSAGVKYNLGLTPGRRRANQAFKMAMDEESPSDSDAAESLSTAADAAALRCPPGIVFDLGPTLTGVGEFTDPRDENYFPTYIDYFQKKAQKRALLVAELTKKYDAFRQRLAETETENLKLRAKTNEFESLLQLKDKEIQKLRKRLQAVESSSETLKKNHADTLTAKRDLESELEVRAQKIKHEKEARRRLQEEMASKMSLWEKHMNSKYETEMRKQFQVHEAEKRVQAERFEALREIVNSDDPRAFTHGQALLLLADNNSNSNNVAADAAAGTPATPKNHVKNVISSLEARGTTPGGSTETISTPEPTTTTPVAAPRHNGAAPWASAHVGRTASRTTATLRARSPSASRENRQLPPAAARRRSKSQGANVWLDHRPVPLLATDNLMQASLPAGDKRRKSNGEINAKDVEKSSKYMMTAQRVDSEGEIETHVVKGDIIPTLAGGTEVKMTEVEIVQRRRLSPGENKKRSYSKTRAPTDADQVEEVQERCKIAIEGHGNQRRSRKN